MRRLALFLLVLSLGACDSAPLAPRADSSTDPDGAELLAKRGIRIADGSFDWNFRIENLDIDSGIPVTFRETEFGPIGGGDELSRITMTALSEREFAFTASWDGYDHPASELYAVRLDQSATEGLSVLGPIPSAPGDTTTTTDKGKSYHNTHRGPVIDFVDTDDGLLPTPTTAHIQSRRGTISLTDVAYLVYLPTGQRTVQAPSKVVQVYGPDGARVVTESIGSGELPQIVRDLR